MFCLLLPKFAVRESYNPYMCQNGSIVQTVTHTKISMFTAYNTKGTEGVRIWAKHTNQEDQKWEFTFSYIQMTREVLYWQ